MTTEQLQNAANLRKIRLQKADEDWLKKHRRANYHMLTAIDKALTSGMNIKDITPIIGLSRQRIDKIREDLSAH